MSDDENEIKGPDGDIVLLRGTPQQAELLVTVLRAAAAQQTLPRASILRDAAKAIEVSLGQPRGDFRPMSIGYEPPVNITIDGKPATDESIRAWIDRMTPEQIDEDPPQETMPSGVDWPLVVGVLREAHETYREGGPLQRHIARLVLRAAMQIEEATNV